MGGAGAPELDSELEERWVNVLAWIYGAVRWDRVARGRSSHDIFEHRVQFAKYKQTVPEVLERLMNSLGLQAPPLPLEDVEFLRENEERALEVLRRWTKLIAIKAADRSWELRAAKRAERAKEGGEEGGGEE